MYKYLIIGVAFMFISAGAYYINQAGGGLISNIVAGNINEEDNLTPINPENIPGTYICNTTSTCQNKYILSLKNDATVELTRTIPSTENNNDITTSTVSTEKGIWDLAIQNMLIITILGDSDTTYDIPQKIVIKNVKNTTLSKISYTRSKYKDMISPIFIKQE